MAEQANSESTVAAPAPSTTSVPSVQPVSAQPAQNMVPQSVVDRITAEKWDAIRAKEESDRKAALAQATLEELRKVAGGSESVQRTQPTTNAQERLSPEELSRLVQEQSAVNDFNKQCNDAVEKGRAVHKDFDQVVIKDLIRLSPVYDPRVGGPILPQPLVEAALATGEAHEVLYALGKDSTSAERILRLSPIKQAFEIAKLHDKIVAARAPAEGEAEGDVSEEDAEGNAPAPEEVFAASSGRAKARANVEEDTEGISKAPPPIRSRAGAGSAVTRPAFNMSDTSKSSIEDWIAQREAQVRARAAKVRR
jgi:hypothetical protein